MPPIAPTHRPAALFRHSLAEVRGVLRLAVPGVVGLISGTAMGVVDTLMIAPLGTTALAATGLATSALIIVHAALFGLMSVVSVGMAQAFGARDHARLGRTLRHGLVLALLIGSVAAGAMAAALPLFQMLDPSAAVLTTLRPYWIALAAATLPYTVLMLFRGLYNAVDRPWVAVWIALSGVALNVPLNALLIYGAFDWGGLGLLGAGIASLLAKSFALALAVGHWRLARSMRAFRQRGPVDGKTLLGQLRDGWPAALGSLGEGSAYAVAGLMMSGFGVAALAANQVVHTIGAILYMVPMGMTVAIGVRVGQAAGAGETTRLRPIGLAATGVVLAWMTGVLLLLLVFRYGIAEALSDDAAVIALAVPMFLTIAFTQFADGLQSTALGGLRGLMDNRVPNLISLVAYWALALPLAHAAGFGVGWGPTGIWIGYGAGIMAAALVLQVRYWRRTAALIRPG